MAKDIPLAGSDDRGDDKFEKAYTNDKQLDYLVGNKETGQHCHMYREHDTGKTGVEHRGKCAVDEDKAKANENGQ